MKGRKEKKRPLLYRDDHNGMLDYIFVYLTWLVTQRAWQLYSSTYCIINGHAAIYMYSLQLIWVLHY